MKRNFIIAAAASLMLLGEPASAAQASQFVVLVNPANPVRSLTTEQASKLFLKKSRNWETGGAVVPVDLPENAPARAAFSRAVHKKAVAAIVSYWHQQIFSGANTPPTTKSEADAVEFVRNTPGAIAYVSPGADTRGVKVVPVN